MSRTNLNDFQEAIEAVGVLLAKYAHKDEGVVPKWQEIGLFGNLKHLREHVDAITQANRPMPTVPFSFEDFVSSACRGLMLLQHAIKTHPEAFEDWKRGK